MWRTSHVFTGRWLTVCERIARNGQAERHRTLVSPAPCLLIGFAKGRVARRVLGGELWAGCGRLYMKEEEEKKVVGSDLGFLVYADHQGTPRGGSQETKGKSAPESKFCPALVLTCCWQTAGGRSYAAEMR